MNVVSPDPFRKSHHHTPDDMVFVRHPLAVPSGVVLEKSTLLDVLKTGSSVPESSTIDYRPVLDVILARLLTD